jgi:hypothetical protein
MTTNGDQPAGELTTSTSPAARTNSPNPDHSTTLTVRAAANTAGVHPNTVRRKLRAGQVPGAFMAPGPMGDEWRIPVTSLHSLTPDRPHPVAATAAAISDQRSEVDRLRQQLELSRLEADLLRSERDRLATALTTALEKLPPALPPAPEQPRRWWRRNRTS